MSERIGTCQDCGVSIDATGKRGRLPSRCAGCATAKKVEYNRKRYEEFPEKRYVQPRASTETRFRELVCSECQQPFKVQIKPGGLPKACDSCKHERRMRVAREVTRPEPVRLSQRLRRYGLSVEDWHRMNEEQDGVCHLCGRPPSADDGRYSRLEVDHDHVTGKVRALLCPTCNTALGKLQDDPELMRKAADYVEHHRQGYDG